MYLVNFCYLFPDQYCVVRNTLCIPFVLHPLLFYLHSFKREREGRRSSHHMSSDESTSIKKQTNRTRGRFFGRFIKGATTAFTVVITMKLETTLFVSAECLISSRSVALAAKSSKSSRPPVACTVH